MEDNTLPKPRPVLVTILAILTIIGAVLAFGVDALKELVPELARYDVPLPIWITVVSYCMTIGKLIAAIFLLRMKRIGFYAYAACESIQAILSIVGGKISMEYMDAGYSNPNIVIDPKVLMLFLVGLGVGLSIVFIGGYAAHLSKMD
jgi:hypothetical protein